MMPRLTKFGREQHSYSPCIAKHPRASRPSPAERQRQRRKARAAVIRSMDRKDNAELHIAYMMGNDNVMGR